MRKTNQKTQPLIVKERSIAGLLPCLYQTATRTAIAGIVGIASLCAIQLTASVMLPGSQLDARVYAQKFGDGLSDDHRSRQGSDNGARDAIRRNPDNNQARRAEREQVVDEIRRRFPGAHVLKIRPVGDDVYRARVLTPGGKVKIVNVRAEEF